MKPVARLLGHGLRWAGVESATTILSDEQDIAVGDQIWITQPGYPADLGHVVAQAQPGRALVLAVSTPQRPSAPEDAPWTWAFVLRPTPDNTTRLIVRNRNATVGAVAGVVWDRVVGPIGFAMERKTMLTIKDRAEAAAVLPSAALSSLLAAFALLVATVLWRHWRSRSAGLEASTSPSAPRRDDVLVSA